MRGAGGIWPDEFAWCTLVRPSDKGCARPVEPVHAACAKAATGDGLKSFPARADMLRVTPTASAVVNPNLAGKTILIAEDEFSMKALLTRMFRQWGARVLPV